MAVIMVKIFLFIGLFSGFRYGVGIAYWRLRVIVKRACSPAKCLTVREDIEVLAIGLERVKRSDASDMYLKFPLHLKGA